MDKESEEESPLSSLRTSPSRCVPQYLFFKCMVMAIIMLNWCVLQYLSFKGMVMHAYYHAKLCCLHLGWGTREEGEGMRLGRKIEGEGDRKADAAIEACVAR